MLPHEQVLLSQRSPCVKEKMAKGMSPKEAEDACSKGYNYLPSSAEKPSKAVKTEDGYSWLSTHATLGTGAVIWPDYVVTAKDWARSVLRGRLPLPANRSEWDEYARRSGLSAENAERGWAVITKTPHRPLRLQSALAVLDSVFGENTSWTGYSVPNIFQIRTPHQPAPGFGFRTGAAEKIWIRAVGIMKKNPKMLPREVTALALQQDDQVLPFELTPEDYRLIDMGLYWIQSGKGDWAVPAGVPPRIGGMPGGPFNSVSYLGRRGAP